MNGVCGFCQEEDTSASSRGIIVGNCGCKSCLACLRNWVSIFGISSEDLLNKSISCPQCEAECSFPLDTIPLYMMIQQLAARATNLSKRADRLLREEVVPQQNRPSIPITSRKLELMFVACPVCLSYTLPVTNKGKEENRFKFFVEVSVPSSSPTILVVDYTKYQSPGWKKTKTYAKIRKHITLCASTFFLSPFRESMIPRFYQRPKSELCTERIVSYYNTHPGAPEPSEVLKKGKNESEDRFMNRVDKYLLDDFYSRREKEECWEKAHQKYWDYRKKEQLLRLISANYSMPIQTHMDDAAWKILFRSCQS